MPGRLLTRWGRRGAPKEGVLLPASPLPAALRTGPHGWGLEGCCRCTAAKHTFNPPDGWMCTRSGAELVSPSLEGTNGVVRGRKAWRASLTLPLHFADCPGRRSRRQRADGHHHGAARGSVQGGLGCWGRDLRAPRGQGGTRGLVLGTPGQDGTTALASFHIAPPSCRPRGEYLGS